MKAVTFQAIESLSYEDVPEPQLLAPRDAIVQVATAGLCGSDLHPYFGNERGLDVGTVMGHEFVGRIVALGDGIARRAGAEPRSPLHAHLELGSKVVAPFTTNCGECAYCNTGLTARCLRGELFGWVAAGQGLHGAQAEFVRVPFADTTLVPVPDSLPDDALALLAGDILSTAMFGADLARVTEGQDAAVVGCGPVGLLAIRAAFERGASRVFAIDRVQSRLAQAETFGAVPLDLSRSPVEEVMEATAGLGVPSVIEAVGHPSATRLSADLCRHGAAIGAVGVHTEAHLEIPPGEIYDRNLTYAGGRCPARRYLPESLAVAERDQSLLSSMISHRLPLADAIMAYRSFGAREPGWAKVVFTP